MIETLSRPVRAIATVEPPVSEGVDSASVRRRRGGLGLVAVGIATVVLAVAGLFTTRAQPESPFPSKPSGTRPASLTAHGVSTAGNAEAVQVQMVTYVPRQSSGWHHHTGVHAIAVISGTLTVYDGECQPHRYGPGEAYIGGQGLHLARNEADEPIEMAVTYVLPSGTALEETIAGAPPAGCPVA